MADRKSYLFLRCYSRRSEYYLKHINSMALFNDHQGAYGMVYHSMPTNAVFP